MSAVRFFSEETTFKLPHPRKTSAWITSVLKKEGASLRSITYIFCTDLFLLGINKEFLKHDTLTDIITFDYSEGGQLEGEIYISIERVRENAKSIKTDFDTELHRVIIHGVLHLLGFKDKSPADKALMRKKEEACLSLRK